MTEEKDQEKLTENDSSFFTSAANQLVRALFPYILAMGVEKEEQEDVLPPDWLDLLRERASISFNNGIARSGPMPSARFEEATLKLVKKLRTLSPKPIFSSEDGTPLYNGFRGSHFLVQLETILFSSVEILRIFDLSVLMDFSKDDFFKVLQAQIRNTHVEFEYLDENFSLEQLEGIGQSIK